MPDPAQFFDLLPGAWRFDRQIPGQASMQGTARFMPRDDGALHYHEQGELVLPDGQRLQAHRAYRYTRQPDGFCVWFDEMPPRLFHRIVLSRTAAGQTVGIEAVAGGSAMHLCGADRYDTVYGIHADGSWSIRHEVSGPRKRYVSLTRFCRA